ncbi:diguanylate cyclase [Thalassiella azotivora]
MSGTSLVLHGDFGPLHHLAAAAHLLYTHGRNDAAVSRSREGLALATAAGDERTVRFLRYVAGIAAQESGRHAEAVTWAQELLADVDPVVEPYWRAKGLALLAEACTSTGEMTRAMDALAEGAYLVARHPSNRYNHMSAGMAVAIALRSLMLFEQSEEMLAAGSTSDPYLDLLVQQETALLHLQWGATVDLVGRDADARARYRVALSTALRMQALARVCGDDDMHAKALLYQAVVWERWGEPGLAESAVRDALASGPQRAGTVERDLSELTLGRVLAGRGRFAVAREHLAAAVRGAERAGRDVWAAAALTATAEVDEAESGYHPAVGRWRWLARAVMERMWHDREGRFSALQARMRVRELMDRTGRMEQEVLEDPLTGLGNRRRLAEHVAGSDRDLSVVFVDIDRFKDVNDTFSHEVGDLVILRLADILRTHCRVEDVVVRYGGDEFLVVVSGDPAAARTIAGRILQAVRESSWHDLAPGLRVTVSVGLATSLPAPDALGAADSALYSAKRAGRDQLVVF